MMKVNTAIEIKRWISQQTKKTGIHFNDVAKSFLLYEFLYRLSQTKYADQYAIHGGLACLCHLDNFNRITNDGDMGFIPNYVKLNKKTIKK